MTYLPVGPRCRRCAALRVRSPEGGLHAQSRPPPHHQPCPAPPLPWARTAPRGHRLPDLVVPADDTRALGTCRCPPASALCQRLAGDCARDIYFDDSTPGGR